MGTLGTLLLVGGGLVVLYMGFNIYRNFFTKEGQQKFEQQLRTPEAQKSIKQLEIGLHALENPPIAKTTPPKAIHHAHLGRFMSLG